jgi:hypothetical protein
MNYGKNQPIGKVGAPAVTKVRTDVHGGQNFTNRYPARMTLRVPSEIVAAVGEVAGAQFTSPSEYIRRAVLAALRADGVVLKPEGGRQ